MQTSLATTRQTTQIQLSQEPKPELSRKLEVMAKLASCCLDRGEAMDEIRLESYSKALVEEFPDDADTLSALDKLSLTPRGEFEPIIPSKVDLIRLVRNMGWARKRAARESAEAEAERVYAEKLAAEKKAGLFEPVDVADLVAEFRNKRTKVEAQ